MAHGIFNSVRNLYHFKTKYINQSDAVGEHYKKHTINEYGSIPEPSCIEYDQCSDIVALGSKKGSIKIFGKPGLCFSITENENDEIIKLKFIHHTNFFISLTINNKLSLWYMCKTTESIIKIDTIANIANLFSEESSKPIKNDDVVQKQIITTMEVLNITSSLILGDIDGSIMQVKLNLDGLKKVNDQNYRRYDSSLWNKPSRKNILHCNRIINKFPSGLQWVNREKLSNLGQVIKVTSRAGSSNQVLICYQNNLCVLYNIQTDSIESILRYTHHFTDYHWLPAIPYLEDRLLLDSAHSKKSDPSGPQYKLNCRLLSGHVDGAIVLWNLLKDGDEKFAVKEAVFFPFEEHKPCYPIKKILSCRSKCDSTLIIFSGGLPKPDYLGKSTVTITTLDALQGISHKEKSSGQSYPLVFELSSDLVDIKIIENKETLCGDYLIILTEEEFLLMDIRRQSDRNGHDCYPIIREQPYLNCLHHSPITAYHFVTNVSKKWLEKISSMSPTNQNPIKTDGYSDWPIHGEPIIGRRNLNNSESNLSWLNKQLNNNNNTSSTNKIDEAHWSSVWMQDVLITGHADGSIVFWRLGKGGCIRRIARVTSSRSFSNLEQEDEPLDFDDWTNQTVNQDCGDIPMMRIGVFDPCTDDNRLAIQLIHFTGTYLVAGGFAGQVILWGFLSYKYELKQLEVDLTNHLTNFNWRGCRKLQLHDSSGPDSPQKPVRAQHHQSQCRFQPMAVVNIWPPSQVTALDLSVLPTSVTQSDSVHVIIAMGTMHGVVMAACSHGNNSPSSNRPDNASILTSHCTVPKWSGAATEEAGLGDGWARRRTRDLKKSLRESFRKIRRRSTKRAPNPSSSMTGRRNKPGLDECRVEMVENQQTNQNTEFQERLIEDRPQETANIGLIRSLRICITNSVSNIQVHQQHHKVVSDSNQDLSVNLFAGSGAGLLLWFQATETLKTNKKTDLSLLNFRPIKQYQLQHRAPVVFMGLMANDGTVYSSGLNIINRKNNRSNSVKINQLLMVTEEQVRIYELPGWKLKYKLRVTAADGYRLKTGSMVALNKINARASLENMICSTNNGGQMLFLSAHNLKKKDIVQFVDRTDLMALNYISLAVCCHLDGDDDADYNSDVDVGSNCANEEDNAAEETRLQPYGVHHSGHGQVTLFRIIPKSS